MFYKLTTSNGNTEAVIDDNCGISKFYAIASTMEDELKVDFINQIDDAEILNWHFKYNGELLTLRYNIFNGVSIYAQANKKKAKETSTVTELAELLNSRIY